ncbi:MAG: Ig-like domain-containing protein [Lachnospiraceae bacterium]
MKVKKTVKRTLAFVLAAMLTAGTAVIPASAEEFPDDAFQDEFFQGNDTQGDSVQDDMGQDDAQEDNAQNEWQEPGTTVSGVRATLKPSEYIRDMDWGYFSEAPDSGSWIGRMELPDFAVNLYNTLAAGSDNDGVDDILIEDSVFTEEQALTVSYSNGKQDVFNGIEVLNLTYDAKMEDEEWEAIQENICQAFNAFRLDYPGVFWLKDSLKVTRVLTEQTDETGAAYYNYQVYLLLKNYGRKYDIRSKKYQSAEAIRAVMTERDTSLQEVLAGLASDNTADAITYFKDNLKVLAKSMGSSKDNTARALKMLCDNAGIPCILASGAGGALEAYMAVDGSWLATDEIEEMLAAQKKAAEEQAKAAEEAVKQENEKKEEEQKQVAAQPAMRQARVMTAAEAASSPTAYASARAATDGQFFIDGSTTPASEAEVLARIVSLQTDANGEDYAVFGTSWQKILKVETGYNTGVEYQPVNGNKVAVAFQLQRLGDSWYPSAGEGREYSLSFTSENGAVKSSIIGKQDIRQRELTVTKGNLSYQRVYRTETFELMPNVSANINNTAPSDVPASERTVTAEPTVIKDENVTNTGEIGLLNGNINVSVTLKGSGASNYVIAGTGGQNTIELSGIPYSCRAQKLESDILEVQLEPGEFTYDGNKKEPKVTVSINGELMSQSVDYSVNYGGDPVNATLPDSIATVQIFPGNTPRKYDWKDVEVKRTYNILKADYEAEGSVSDTIRYGKVKEIDLSPYMPSDASIQSATILDSNIIRDAAPAASNSATLQYEVVNDPKFVDQEGTINVSIGGSRNYNNYAILVNIKVLDKLEQEDFRFQQDTMKLPKKETASVAVQAVEGSTVTYKSSDSSIVSVKNNGTITGVSEGEATITAEATEVGDYKKKTITCKVRVIPQKSTVTTSPVVEQGEYQYRLEIEKGISQKPANLSMEIADIEKRLREEIKTRDSAIADENIDFYDVSLFRRLIDLDDAQGDRNSDWEIVNSDEKFPNGIAVTMPYPESRKDKVNKTSFAVAHMFTEGIDQNPGTIEGWNDADIDKTNDGLQFTVTGLSPIAVGWGPIRNDQNSFKFEYEAMKLPVSGTTSLAVKSPVDGDITYRSSDTDVVTVSANGAVRAVGLGHATITAVAPENDDYRGKTIHCDITVIPRESTASFTTYEFTEGGYRYKLEIEKGISQFFANLPELGAAEIEQRMKEQILAVDSEIRENIGIYDIRLYRRPTDANSTEASKEFNWELVDTEEEFPVDGLEITVPYPEGRGADKAAKTSYTAVHMFTETINGKMPGEMEIRSNDAIEKTTDGLKFLVNGLSPIAVGWAPIREEQPGFKLEYDVRKIIESDEFSLGLVAVEGSTVIYETEDPDIVDIDEEGNVYAIGEGRTTIRAIASGTEDYLPATVTCDFIVIPEESVVDFTEEFTKSGKTYKLEIEKGLSMYPTESLEKDSSEIDEELRQAILKLNSAIPEENIEVYDVALYKKAEDSYSWELVDDKEFPSKLAITLPYPEGRDGDNSAYTVAHMFSEKVNGKKPGKIESWTGKKVKTTDNGLSVTVTGLSPFAVGWEEVTPTPDNPTNPDDPTNPDNPTNPDDPANPNDQNNNTGTNGNNTGTTGTNTGTTGRTATTGSSGATSGTTTGTGTKSAATGDTNQVILYIVLFAAAAAVLGIVFAVRRKRK